MWWLSRAHNKTTSFVQGVCLLLWLHLMNIISVLLNEPCRISFGLITNQKFIRSPNKCESCFWCNFYGSRIMITSIHNRNLDGACKIKLRYEKIYLISSEISKNYLILNNSNHIYISLIFFINFCFPLIFFIYFLSFRKKAKYRKV